MQVAARTYRAWKKRLPALRTIEDARVTDALRSLKVPEAKGRSRRESIYGRRKMTQWLRRNGFPEASKHAVDRLMREEGMNGLVRGRKTRTTVPGKDGRRAGDLLSRDFTAPAPNRICVTDFTHVPVYSGFVYVALVIGLYSRAVVGWETSTIKDTAFVEHCLRMALWRREQTGRPVLAGLIPSLHRNFQALLECGRLPTVHQHNWHSCAEQRKTHICQQIFEKILLYRYEDTILSRRPKRETSSQFTREQRCSHTAVPCTRSWDRSRPACSPPQRRLPMPPTSRTENETLRY